MSRSYVLLIRRVLIAGGMLLCGCLAACHTVEGAGKDIQDLGEAIEDAADED